VIFCVWLMLSLAAVTWVVFGVWMIFVVYFTTLLALNLRHTPKEPARV
jgi:hypothetical protein